MIPAHGYNESLLMKLGIHLYLPACTLAQGQCWLKLLCIWNVRGLWQIPTYFNSNCKRLIILLYFTMACIFFPLDNSKTRASTQPPNNDFRTKRCSFLSHRAESTEVAPLTLDRGFNDLKNFASSLWDTSKVSAWRSLNAMRPYFQSPIFWPVTSITWLGLETLRGKL